MVYRLGGRAIGNSYFHLGHGYTPLITINSQEVKTLPSSAEGEEGSISGQGTKIPRLGAKKLKHKTEAIL